MRTEWQFGDVTIQRVVEQEGRFLPALDMLPDLTPALLAENREWLEAGHALDGDNFCLCFQSFVVRTPDHIVLIDTCVGNDKPRPRAFWNMLSSDRYLTGLAALGLTPEDIDYVMCTHLHVDHVGWNTRLLDGRWVPTFPNARYLFGRTEYAHWETVQATAPTAHFADSVLPVIEAGRADLISDEHALGDHIRLLPTPGHTPGHLAILIGARAIDAVVSGDLIHSPLQARYPELSVRFDTDMAAAARTRRTFLERFCDTATVCCMTHFPSPSLGRLTRWGEGFRCEPT